MMVASSALRQTIERLIAGFPVGDQLCDHWVVKRRDLAARLNPAIDTYAPGFRKFQSNDPTGRGQEPALGSSA